MGQTGKRISSYIITSIVLAIISYICLTGMLPIELHSSRTHSLVQAIATLIAFFVGSAALYRYYKVEIKSPMLLFIGVGFLGTGVIDAYHTIVTSTVFSSTYPSFPASATRWSWVATRILLSILLLLSLVGIWWEGTTSFINEKIIYSVVIFFTLATLIVFSTVPIPFPMYPNDFLTRPEEFIPGGIFLIALIGYLAKGGWKTDVLQHWLVLCLIASVFCQFFFMGESKYVFDLTYIMAHFVKILSYAMVYIGITAI